MKVTNIFKLVAGPGLQHLCSKAIMICTYMFVIIPHAVMFVQTKKVLK